MSLRGRLSGHFLARVFLLFVALGFVFIAWFALLLWSATTASQPDLAGYSPSEMLKRIEAATTFEDSSTVIVGRDELDRVDAAAGWLQVLDVRGAQIYSYNVPSEVPTAYAPGQLVLLRTQPSRVGQGSIHTWYSAQMGGITWVLGSEDVWVTPLQAALPKGIGFIQSLAILFAGSAAVALLIAWVSGSTLARPLIHAMTWIEGLARGEYREPVDRKGRLASKGPGGDLRRPYRTYREVIGALDTLTAELAETEAERQRLETAREEWLTGISHDLRTPLSSVRGYADLLSSDYEFSAEEVREHARVIAEKSADMERLIGDLSLTFRLRSDALPLEPARTDLVELTREAVISLANDPRAEGREIVFDGPGEESAPGDVSAAEGMIVEVDRGYYARALSNLLVNAVTHNPEGTQVQVSVRVVDGWACVDITDTGNGMDEATLARLFDRYYRGGASGSDAAGTGLGMAIARQLIEAHGGHVQVTTAVDAGTTVRVCVPLADAQACGGAGTPQGASS